MSGSAEAPLLLLNDGRPGHWRQVSALADRLSAQQDVLEVLLHHPWRAFAPRSLPLGLTFHRSLARSLPPLPPTAILSCGRRSALVMRWLTRHWGGAPMTVQILDSGIDPSQFDYVIVPRHDRIAGRNVIRIRGSLNPVDEGWLERAARSGVPGEWQNHPIRIVLLLGGSGRHMRFDRRWAGGIMVRVAEAARAVDGVVTAVASPRTPGWARSVAEASGIERFVPWSAEQDEGSYPVALAMATHLVSTADSVNLLSESCATGKPVFVAGADRVRGRLRLFVSGLLDDAYALDVAELIEALRTGRRTRVLRETPAVAVQLKRSGRFG